MNTAEGSTVNIDSERLEIITRLIPRIDDIAASTNGIGAIGRETLDELRDHLLTSTHALNIHMLRVLDKFLSLRHQPMMIHLTAVGVSGIEGHVAKFDWDSIPAAVYESITAVHIDTFITVMERYLNQSLARFMTRHTDQLPEFYELMNRGVETEQQLEESLREMAFGKSQALVDGAL